MKDLFIYIQKAKTPVQYPFEVDSWDAEENAVLYNRVSDIITANATAKYVKRFYDCPVYVRYVNNRTGENRVVARF